MTQACCEQKHIARHGWCVYLLAVMIDTSIIPWNMDLPMPRQEAMN